MSSLHPLVHLVPTLIGFAFIGTAVLSLATVNSSENPVKYEYWKSKAKYSAILLLSLLVVVLN